MTISNLPASIPPRLADWLDEWVLDLSAGRPGAETITIYRRSISQFYSWLVENAPEVHDVDQISWSHCRDWTRHLIDQGKSDSTRRVRGIALRKFLAYVVAEPDSGLDRNPADKLELPMPEAPVVPVIADEDLAKLIRSMSGTNFVDRRDTAIVRVLLDTGMRRGELVGIDLDDLNLRGQEVLVHGKGGRDRIVPFSGKTALSLRKYLRARATHGGAESPALFLSMRLGKSWRLTGGSVGEMISRRCQSVGLGHIHPHQLRHTWASDMKASGVSDQQLEVLAGWTPGSIMSRRYGSALADQQARNAARRLARGDRV